VPNIATPAAINSHFSANMVLYLRSLESLIVLVEEFPTL
jgi:hypothetical protein